MQPDLWGCKAEKTNKVVEVVEGNVILNQRVTFTISTGKVVGKRAPVEVLLGRPFLLKNSKDFRIMLEEFSPVGMCILS